MHKYIALLVLFSQGFVFTSKPADGLTPTAYMLYYLKKSKPETYFYPEMNWQQVTQAMKNGETAYSLYVRTLFREYHNFDAPCVLPLSEPGIIASFVISKKGTDIETASTIRHVAVNNVKDSIEAHAQLKSQSDHYTRCESDIGTLLEQGSGKLQTIVTTRCTSNMPLELFMEQINTK